MNKALVVGIDNYPSSPLSGCVADANTISELLEYNGDGSPNFSVVKLIAPTMEVSAGVLLEKIKELFSGEADTALFFFAGHGILDPDINAGYLVTQDGKNPHWGISLESILTLANAAYPKIRSSVIVLDCCHSGYAGEIPALGQGKPSIIGTGVTILTACKREGYAGEENGQGIFTTMLIDGLRGSSADILGRITPAALYAHVDQALGPWAQRPVYKANVNTFINLRSIQPKVPLETLRKLSTWFPDQAYEYTLDPSYEPNRDNVPEEIMNIPPDPEKNKIFAELQLCNRYGLVIPVGEQHMYYAAINSKSCKLTALGAHYRNLAENKRF